MSPLRFFLLTFAIGLAVLVLLVSLPHDRYHRFQSYDNGTTRKADWIYERLHFDATPVDVAILGTSRSGAALSGPGIEAAFCEVTGRRIHVANLSIPQTGRDIHYIIGRELFRTKTPRVVSLELNENQWRWSHPGFVFLAEPADIVTAPLLLNPSYFLNLLRLPGRQAERFLETATGNPPIRPSFDLSAYVGPHLDRTRTIARIDGTVRFKNTSPPPEKLTRAATRRLQNISAPYILPAFLRDLEYRLPRYYTDAIRAEGKARGANLQFHFLPIFTNETLPPYMVKEFVRDDPIVDLAGGDFAEPSNWFDATHLNEDGAALASDQFSRFLAKTYPSLGQGTCR